MSNKTYTVGGDAAYSLMLRTIFTFSEFVVALTETKFDGDFDIDFATLKKKDAKKYLLLRLQRHGRRGQYWGESDDMLGPALSDEYNQYYDEAKQWVERNYPYLLTKAIKK